MSLNLIVCQFYVLVSHVRPERLDLFKWLGIILFFQIL